ncbi:MAG: phosphoribosylanthranilate isomerase [Nitrospirae bacterium]|nr:phosphoribosylanthranilate isomerase [Nitrospirota bacterium]
MVRIKICGITNLKDAIAAAEYGADALGFIFYPRSPRAVTPRTARNIISKLPPFVTTVGVFVDKKPADIEKIVKITGLNIVQLHGSEPPEDCKLSMKVIKAIKVRALTDLKILKKYKTVSAFLLDTYSSKIHGGTGQVFNWDIAVEAKKFGRIILAGGLTPENIEQAVKQVQPYGVDVVTGVEGNKKGIKDHKKLRLFIERAKKAFKEYT